MLIDLTTLTDAELGEYFWHLTDAWYAAHVFDPATMPHLVLPPATAESPSEHFGPLKEEMIRRGILDCDSLARAAHVRLGR